MTLLWNGLSDEEKTILWEKLLNVKNLFPGMKGKDYKIAVNQYN